MEAVEAVEVLRRMCCFRIKGSSTTLRFSDPTKKCNPSQVGGPLPPRMSLVANILMFMFVITFQNGYLEKIVLPMAEPSCGNVINVNEVIQISQVCIGT